MHYPLMMYGPGTTTRTVRDDHEEREAAAAGFGLHPSEAHRAPPRGATTVQHEGSPALTEAHLPLIAEAVRGGLDDAPAPLTEAHIPAIVDAVFDRLKGMAQAAAAEPGAREAADGVAALHEGLDERFATLRAGLLEDVRALIGPAPAPTTGKSRA